MKPEVKDKVLRQLVGIGTGCTWNIDWREGAKEINLPEDEYYKAVEIIAEDGYIEIVTMRRTVREARICVNHSAEVFLEEGGYESAAETERLNKEYLLLQVKHLQTECENLDAEGKKLKKGDQTAIERILSAGANLATIATSIIEPIMKFA